MNGEQEKQQGEPQKELCPLCGESNWTSVAYCRRCRYRLPWADALEGVTHERAPEKESLLDRGLKRWGFLPENIACRYCKQPISVDDKQCPHCKRWLTSVLHEFETDSSQKDFREENLSRVDLLPPRAKGLSQGLMTLLLGIAFCGGIAAIGWLLWRLLP